MKINKPFSSALSIAAANLMVRTNEDLVVKPTAPAAVEFEWQPPEYEVWSGPVTPYIRLTPKQSRNSKCGCGSEKKFKKCCGKNL